MEPEADDTLVRAARELLRWDQKQLARAAGVGLATVRRFETGATVEDGTIEAIARALRGAGVAFCGPAGFSERVMKGVALTVSGRPLPRPGKRVYRKRSSTSDGSSPASREEKD